MPGPAFVRRSAILVAVAACAVAALAGTAGATTIGDTSTPTLGCDPSTLYAALSHPVPGPGQITSFSFHSVAGNSGDVEFYVLRPTGVFGHMTVVGTSGPVAMDSADEVQTYGLSHAILVLPGDVFGLYYPPSSTVAACKTSLAETTQAFGGLTTAPSPGDTVDYTSTSGAGLSVSANFIPSTALPTNSGEVVTGPVLESGVPYEITVRGTYSAYMSSLMSGDVFKWVVCGSPEPAAQFGAVSGAVGQDAERIFARPERKTCNAKFTFPGPYKRTNPAVVFNIGDGPDFVHLTPTDSLYHPDHSYTYDVMGQDAALQLKLLDSQYNDNYGTLEVDAVAISS